MSDKVIKSDAEWRKILTPEQYRVTRAKGTERACSGVFYEHKGEGAYHCICCGNPLFRSAEKYDSGSGWPSYWAPIAKDGITEVQDKSLGMVRTEILCARCDAHLGHVFDDGPPPTGKRYCINSVSLKFIPSDKDGSKAQ